MKVKELRKLIGGFFPLERIDHKLAAKEADEMAKEALVDFRLDRALREMLDEDDIEEKIQKYAKKVFEEQIAPKIEGDIKNFSYTVNWFSYIRDLKADYIRARNTDCLVWLLRTYHPMTLITLEDLYGPSANKIGRKECEFYRDAYSTDRDTALLTPLTLLGAWARGELEVEEMKLYYGSEDQMLYEFAENKERETIPTCFYRWFTSLGSEPFERLKHIDVVDDVTYKIVKEKLTGLERAKEAEVAKIEFIKLSKRDVQKLKLIAKTKEALSFSQWGGLFGTSKQGAQSALKRLEGQGLIKLEKGNGGIKAILTEKGKRAISFV